MDLAQRVEHGRYRRQQYRNKIGSAAADLKRCAKWCAFALRLTHTGKFPGEITGAWNEARLCFQDGIINFKPKHMKSIDTVIRSLGLLSHGRYLAIVLMENETQQITCRIGTSWETDKNHLDTVNRVMEYGGKLLQAEALAFFPDHTDRINEHWKNS